MVIVREEYCPKNHACPVISVCPVDAITQANHYSAPKVDNEACIECQKCSRACGVFLCVGCGNK